MDLVELLKDLVVHVGVLAVVVLEEGLELLDDHEDLAAHHLFLVDLRVWQRYFLR